MSDLGEGRAVRRYLLGQLGEAESEQLETRVMGDAALFEVFTAVEDDLIEDYLSGLLSAGERRDFESHFLASPRQRQSVELRRMVRDHMLSKLSARGAGRPRSAAAWPGWAAAAVALLAAGAAFVLLRRPDPVREARQTPTATSPAAATPSPGASPDAGATASPGASPPAGASVARLTLSPYRTMGAERDLRVLRLRPDHDRVEIEILVEGPEAYARLRARLSPPDGTSVERAFAPRPILVFRVPARQLAPGVHTLVLLGTLVGSASEEEVDRQRFVVERRPS